MKTHLFALLAGVALPTLALAESTVTLSGVHLCCKSCVTGAEKAVAKVSGATAKGDGEAGTVAITAADDATVQKAVDSLVEAGYFGTSDKASVQVKSVSGAKDAKVTSLAVNDVHLCCKKCVTAVSKALESVKGVTGNTAEKGAKTFQVQGEFSPKEVFAALEKQGLTGKASN